MKNIIPEVGTEIPIKEGQTSTSRDGSQFCRIRFEKGQWLVAHPALERGLLAFLQMDPDFSIHSKIRITEIQRSGRGVYALPVAT
jgi:hypothetical protein